MSITTAQQIGRRKRSDFGTRLRELFREATHYRRRVCSCGGTFEIACRENVIILRRLIKDDTYRDEVRARAVCIHPQNDEKSRLIAASNL